MRFFTFAKAPVQNDTFKDMEKGTKILWDTGATYNTGQFIKTSNVPGHYIIKLTSGHFKKRELCVPMGEVMKYTDENLILMNKRYGNSRQ